MRNEGPAPSMVHSLNLLSLSRSFCIKMENFSREIYSEIYFQPPHDDRVRIYESGLRPTHARHSRSRSRDRNGPGDITNITRGHMLDVRQVSSRISNSSSLPELMRHVRDNRKCLDFICASAAVSKGAKLMNKGLKSDITDFMDLVEISRNFLNRMDARGFVTLLRSLVISGQCKEGVIREILSHAEPKLRDFQPFQCLPASVSLPASSA